MPIGYKTGGRAPGTPNKRTQEAAQILDELGCNPIRGMAEIAMSESHPVELRARMLMELAHYVYPKRKTVDVRVAEPEPREQATSDDVIRWLDEKAESVQANLKEMTAAQIAKPDGSPESGRQRRDPLTWVANQPSPYGESPARC